MLGLEFAEKVLWKLPTAPGWRKSTPSGVTACSLVYKQGVTSLSYDINVVRTMERVPLEQRWSAGNFDWVRVFLWNKGKEDDDADGDLLSTSSRVQGELT